MTPEETASAMQALATPFRSGWELEQDLNKANARIAELEENLKTSRAVDAALSRQFLESIPREHKLRDRITELEAERDNWRVSSVCREQAARITTLEQQLQAALDGHKIAFDAVTAAGARELALRGALETIVRLTAAPADDLDCVVAVSKLAIAALTQPPPPVVPLALAEGLAAALEHVKEVEPYSGLVDPEIVDKALSSWNQSK